MSPINSLTEVKLNPAADLNFPLLKLSDNPKDWWRVRHAVEGVQIFGGIGSGKTSGSGKNLAYQFLKNGFGGLVLCAKPDEAALWAEYAKAHGRTDDLIYFQEGSGKQFNFLDYELNRSGRGGGQTINITDLFMTTFKMGQRISGSDSEEQSKFWENALKRCLNRIIDLLKLAGEQVSVSNMVKLLTYAPTDTSTTAEVAATGFEKIPEGREKDYFIQCLYKSEALTRNSTLANQWEMVGTYFLMEFSTLDHEVRSNIKESFLGYCEPFLMGILQEHFGQGTNVMPEESFNGKIIIMDFPVKEYLTAGIYAQCIFKHLWQQAVERREVTKETTPVFLWVDECQYFVNEYDSIFQTTARSSKACTVFLTQNISNYYAHMGGKQVTAKVDSLLGNLSTKIFHCNNDAVTNEWASRVIAKKFTPVESGGISGNLWSWNMGKNSGFSMQLIEQVLPIEFSTLWSGGEEFDYCTQAIVTVKGKEWADGNNYKRAVFKQNINSKTS